MVRAECPPTRPPNGQNPPRNCQTPSRPARRGVYNKPSKSTNSMNRVPQTSTAEGFDSGLMIKAWQTLAASESRLELMGKLKKINLGLAEVEEFNLGLNIQFRSEKSKEKLANGESKVVRAAMESKLLDETFTHSDATR